MVSDEILSSFVGFEVTVRFVTKGHISGILETMDKDSILLRMDDGGNRAISRSKIKYIERKPPGSNEFENAIRNELQNLVKNHKAKTEKEAVLLLKRRFNKDIEKK